MARRFAGFRVPRAAPPEPGFRGGPGAAVPRLAFSLLLAWFRLALRWLAFSMLLVYFGLARSLLLACF